MLNFLLQPKYIANLLKSAKQRQKDYERRVEKDVQREREEEAGQFDDKESFVTSSYLKKRQEMLEEEEKERKQEAIEGWCNVTVGFTLALRETIVG